MWVNQLHKNQTYTSQVADMLEVSNYRLLKPSPILYYCFTTEIDCKPNSLFHKTTGTFLVAFMEDKGLE